MESKRLDNAALAAGISPSYINAHGKPQSIGAETKRRLLDAMHKAKPVARAAVTAVPNVMVASVWLKPRTRSRKAGIQKARPPTANV